MDEEHDEQLWKFTFSAMSSWERLQQILWGARWDFSAPALDFTRDSLLRLSDWLSRAARELPLDTFKLAVGCAGQYFGETVLEHAVGAWQRLPSGEIGLGIELSSEGEQYFRVDELLQVWLDALQEGDGRERGVFASRFDEVLVSARSPRGADSREP